MTYDDHNKRVLDGLGETGSVEYLQASNVLALNPTDAMSRRFVDPCNRGLLRKYDTKYNRQQIFVDPVVNRYEFEQCIHRLAGYGNWEINYIDP